MNIKEIVKQIKNGKMSREIDEKYAGGFWDFAGAVSDNIHRLMHDSRDDKLQENLYGIFYEIVEECLKVENETSIFKSP